MSVIMEELLKEVEALNNNTPDGYVTDADTILADAIGSADLEVTGIAQDVFNIWKNTSDRNAVEQLFYTLTDIEFLEYLEKCKREITR